MFATQALTMFVSIGEDYYCGCCCSSGPKVVVVVLRRACDGLCMVSGIRCQ